jgi:hypothetical protein
MLSVCGCKSPNEALETQTRFATFYMSLSHWGKLKAVLLKFYKR